MIIPVNDFHERRARTPTKVRLEARRISRVDGERRKSDGENVEWALAQIQPFDRQEQPLPTE